MEQKNIIMFFGKKRQESDPFSSFGDKREVYMDDRIYSNLMT